MTNKESKLELRRKLMQMFLLGIPGKELTVNVKNFLKEYNPGGIIYYPRNYDSPALLTEFSMQIQNLAKELKLLPFFLSIEQEGGESQFLKSPFTRFPDARRIGKISSSQVVFNIGKAMAKELRAVGINLNLWPLCDIHTRKNNPMTVARAFGDTEEVVSKTSSAIIRGFIKAGMVACVKYFPGHGDTNISSDMGLPQINILWEKLLERELKPFRKALYAGADICIVGHIMNSALDSLYPASISCTVLTQYLRKELQFKKIIACDDMQRKAITDNFNEKVAVAAAINAGADLLLYHDMKKACQAMDIAWTCVEDATITKERVEESYQRIKEVKDRVLGSFPMVDMANFFQVLGSKAHKELLQSLEESPSL